MVPPLRLSISPLLRAGRSHVDARALANSDFPATIEPQARRRSPAATVDPLATRVPPAARITSGDACVRSKDFSDRSIAGLLSTKLRTEAKADNRSAASLVMDIEDATIPGRLLR